jgi:hypothetical protein
MLLPIWTIPLNKKRSRALVFLFYTLYRHAVSLRLGENFKWLLSVWKKQGNMGHGSRALSEKRWRIGCTYQQPAMHSSESTCKEPGHECSLDWRVQVRKLH